MHAVIANILETRKDTVKIVRMAEHQQSSVLVINRAPQEPIIENQLIEEVVAMHKAHTAALESHA